MKTIQENLELELEDNDEEIAEKDKIISDLKVEIETLKRHLNEMKGSHNCKATKTNQMPI